MEGVANRTTHDPPPCAAWSRATPRTGIYITTRCTGALERTHLCTWSALIRLLKNSSLKAKGTRPKAESIDILSKFVFLPCAFCLVPSGCWLFQQPANLKGCGRLSVLKVTRRRASVSGQEILSDGRG